MAGGARTPSEDGGSTTASEETGVTMLSVEGSAGAPPVPANSMAGPSIPIEETDAVIMQR